MWALAGAAGIMSGFIWGGVSDRLGRKQALAATFLLQGVCFALFAAGGGVLVFGLCALTYGITARAAFTVTAAYCSDLLGERLAVAALGLNYLFAGAGQALGPTIAGFIADLTSSFTAAFWGSAGVALLGALGAVALSSRPVRGPASRPSERLG